MNTTGLTAGTYYGQVQVISAANPEQSVTVVLNVAAAGAQIRPSVDAHRPHLYGGCERLQSGGANDHHPKPHGRRDPVCFHADLRRPASTASTTARPSGQIAPGQTQTITVAPTPVSITRALPARSLSRAIESGFCRLRLHPTDRCAAGGRTGRSAAKRAGQ